MARPTKQGVDYFPLDVHMDDKVKFIEVKYKLAGFAIVIKLLQKIYSEGYWCKWGEDESLLFADECRVDTDLVDKVVTECITRGVFDKGKYETCQILTSKGIQKRFKEIVRRRKEVDVIKEYLLIDCIFEVNDGNNPPNDDTPPASSKQDDGKSAQSKGKDSKPNGNKENNNTPYNAKAFEAWFLMTFNSLVGRQHKALPDKVKTALKRIAKNGYTKEDLIDAIKNCKADSFHQQNNLKYLTPEFITRPDKLEMYRQAPNTGQTANTGQTNAPKRFSIQDQIKRQEERA